MLSIHERAIIQVPSQTTTRVCLLCMGPLLTTRHIDAIERVQRRAARFVTNKYRNTSSVGNMLQHLEWRSLSDRRKDSRLNVFYIIVNDKVEIQKTDRLISQKKNRHDIPTLNASKYHFVKLNTERNLFSQEQ